MKRTGLVLLLLLMIVFTSACTPKDATVLRVQPSAGATERMSVFLRDDSGLVVEVKRDVEIREFLPDDAIRAQTASAANLSAYYPSGLKPMLVKDLEFSVDLVGDVAILDVVGAGLQYETKEKERDAVACLVNTLCQFEPTERVRILVDSKVVDKLPKGTEIKNPLQPMDFNVSGGKGERVKLYFLSSPSGLVVSVSQSYSKTPELKTMLSDMLNPHDNRLISLLPANTRLLEVREEGAGVCLNFSREFLQVGEYPELEMRVLNALYDICVQTKKYSSMSIAVEGLNYTPTTEDWPRGEDISALNYLE